MPVGDCERGVASAAAQESIELVKMNAVPWLNTHGHFALPEMARGVAPILQTAFELLDGSESDQRAKRLGPLPSDLIHRDSNTWVEVDEVQHFTSYRLATIELIPESSAAYDLGEYRQLCERWAPKSDKYRASKVARGFPGANSRARQRAYNDLLRDLVIPLMGFRLVRIPAPMVDGSIAYCNSSDRLKLSIRG